MDTPGLSRLIIRPIVVNNNTPILGNKILFKGEWFGSNNPSFPFVYYKRINLPDLPYIPSCCYVLTQRIIDANNVIEQLERNILSNIPSIPSNDEMNS